jgi:hypothetical protein
LTCKAKAEKVTKPPQAYNGVKWMLHYRAKGKDYYNNLSSVYGTFDWKDLCFSVYIEEGVESAELCLGLEMSSGNAWFENPKIFIGPQAAAMPVPALNPPPPFRGHDLPRLRGAMSPDEFKDGDFRVFADEWNANLVRWQINHPNAKSGTVMDIAKYDLWLDSEIKDLDKLLEAALRYRFKVVIDLHTPPGGRSGDMSLRMFSESKYNEHFVEVWKRLATRYKGHPAVWAYDLVNEPVANLNPAPGMDYLTTQTRAAKAIRAIDTKTTILVESLEMDNPRTFRELVPIDVSNVVYEVHMYEPGGFTHQGVGGQRTGIVYPGKIHDVYYDKEKLREILKPVRDFNLAYNAHIYVGEFSAARWAPGAAKYLSDCIELFEEYGWDWTYHAFREWDGWSVEHEGGKDETRQASSPTDRKLVLLKWFEKNQKPSFK